ncbi:armadillo repeat-containing protein 2-like [Thalassophryne amazonica]|uniref:armadillo repeat-containing protein 2-like n=1 Tax=Thalassophryne amazonica TaxID=390379 RepID=UPI0014724178|nr:armadillo repeat-containing protein 2-like [Thalassophryne amazonica]
MLFDVVLKKMPKLVFLSPVFRSKLSCYVECHLALVQAPGCCQLFIELLSKHHQKQDLIVRLLFTLGNLTSKSHDVRELLFQCENCVDTLLQLYNHYQQRRIPHTLTQRGPQSASKSPTCQVTLREDEDVLVKLVRVLANMCIHPAVGPALATNAACVHLLMETLELRSVQESEELLVNVASTINNMAFYQEERSAIQRNRLTIAKLMLKLVLSSVWTPFSWLLVFMET